MLLLIMLVLTVLNKSKIIYLLIENNDEIKKIKLLLWNIKKEEFEMWS